MQTARKRPFSTDAIMHSLSSIVGGAHDIAIGVDVQLALDRLRYQRSQRKGRPVRPCLHGIEPAPTPR